MRWVYRCLPALTFGGFTTSWEAEHRLTLLRCGDCPRQRPCGGKRPPPSLLFPLVEAASKMGTSTEQPWASSSFSQEADAGRGQQVWPQLPTPESSTWELVLPTDLQNGSQRSRMGICMLMSTTGDSWAHFDLRNIGLRGLGFRMGGSVLVIEIATIYPVPTPCGALFDISNLCNNHPVK